MAHFIRLVLIYYVNYLSSTLGLDENPGTFYSCFVQNVDTIQSVSSVRWSVLNGNYIVGSDKAPNEQIISECFTFNGTCINYIRPYFTAKISGQNSILIVPYISLIENRHHLDYYTFVCVWLDQYKNQTLKNQTFDGHQQVDYLLDFSCKFEILNKTMLRTYCNSQGFFRKAKPRCERMISNDNVTYHRISSSFVERQYRKNFEAYDIFYCNDKSELPFFWKINYLRVRVRLFSSRPSEELYKDSNIFIFKSATGKENAGTFVSSFLSSSSNLSEVNYVQWETKPACSNIEAISECFPQNNTCNNFKSSYTAQISGTTSILMFPNVVSLMLLHTQSCEDTFTCYWRDYSKIMVEMDTFSLGQLIHVKPVEFTCTFVLLNKTVLQSFCVTSENFKKLPRCERMISNNNVTFREISANFVSEGYKKDTPGIRGYSCNDTSELPCFWEINYLRVRLYDEYFAKPHKDSNTFEFSSESCGKINNETSITATKAPIDFGTNVTNTTTSVAIFGLSVSIGLCAAAAIILGGWVVCSKLSSSRQGNVRTTPATISEASFKENEICSQTTVSDEYVQMSETYSPNNSAYENFSLARTYESISIGDPSMSTFDESDTDSLANLIMANLYTNTRGINQLSSSDGYEVSRV